MATPFVRFPGVAGNNTSTPEVNLIDNADTANLQQSIGQWVNNGGTASIVLGQSLTPVFGSNHGEMTASGGADFAAIQSNPGGTSGIPVVGSVEYSWAVYVASPTASRSYQLLIRWFDSGGGQISNHTGPATTLSGVNEWEQAVYTLTSPVNAAFVRMVLLFASVPVPVGVGGETFYFDAAVFRSGGAVFIPALNIVGSSFVDEKASVTPVTYTYSAGNPLVLGEGYAGDVQYWALHDGPDAAAPIVAQMLASDALRALPL